MRTLVVDKDASVCELVGSVAGSFGHRVAAFGDADGALAAFKENPFSIVVVDRNLPGLGGAGLCGLLRELPGGDMAVVVMMTEGHSLDDLDDGLIAGVDDFILKPLDRQSLEMRLKIAERMVLSLWERKHAEHAMRSKEERFRSVVETASDAIICIDRRGEIFYWNRAAQGIFGYGAGEIIGKPVTVIVPDFYRARHAEAVAKAVIEGKTELASKTEELKALRKDGSEFPVELSRAAWRTSKGLFFTGIIRDITERKKTLRLKDEFCSTVSHELKTPLTSIRGALSLVMNGVDLPVEAKRLIEIAHANCERLIPLINDIMDIERIESGKSRYEMATLGLGQLVAQAVEANTAYADQFGVRLTLGRVIPDAFVSGDAVRLMQVMSNLLSNAAKFSKEGDEVVITVDRRDRMLRVSVTDRGPGVPEDFKDRIFQKFAQADSKNTRLKGGTGLGLSISKAIVEGHGGHIGYLMDGNGTTFYFELPEAVEEAAAAAGPPITTFYEDFHEEWRRAAASNEALSLIMVAMDTHKDGRGTDKVAIADALKGAVKRTGDMVLSFDETEFAIVLSATGLQGALLVADRIMTSVEGLKGSRGLTLSIGVASALPNADKGDYGPDRLLDAARQALFQAIHRGGNMVCTSDPSGSRKCYS